MNTRVLSKAVTASALILGAAASLSACASSGTTAASGGSQATATQAGSAAGTVSASASGPGAGGGASGGSGGGDSSSNACQNGQVGVKLTGADAGAGHRGLVLLFTNTGSSTCDLTGYPGATVTANGQDGFTPELNAQRTLSGYEGGAAAVTTVALAPGGTASAVLEWLAAPTNGAAPSAADCPGMAGGYLEITPPNTTASTKFDPPADLCADLQVHPVVAGGSGRS